MIRISWLLKIWESHFMPKGKKRSKKDPKLGNQEETNDTAPKELGERKEGYDEITQELKLTFSLPKYGLKNRTMTVMTRIDQETSKIIDALVALELAPSRSSAAAFLITDAIRKDKEKYMKILECYETIKQAKKKAQYSFYKSLQEESENATKKENNSEKIL